ncbi:MAG: N-acetylneuraminate synthase family protein [Planctomycetota bacterium]
MKIGDREIGPGNPPYVIAEIGVNHDGDVERALMLTDAAADAGAHAVKLQLFETDRLMSKAAKLAAYQKAAGETDPLAMLRRLELNIDDMARVVERAHERGIHAIVSVFSVELVPVAETLAWDAYKTASPDIINKPLLQSLAATEKPMIVSTGTSTLDEVTRAASWLGGAHGEGQTRLAVLQCVSSYPAPDAALDGIAAIHGATGLPTGYSDHTPGTDTGARAVALGACVLEKHLTYDTNATGPDHAASLEPAAFAEYVAQLPGITPEPTGDGLKAVLDCERDVRTVSRQSLVATRDLSPGDVIVRTDLTIKRPGTGLPPFMLDDVVGRAVARAIDADTPIFDADLG